MDSPTYIPGKDSTLAVVRWPCRTSGLGGPQATPPLTPGKAPILEFHDDEYDDEEFDVSTLWEIASLLHCQEISSTIDHTMHHVALVEERSLDSLDKPAEEGVFLEPKVFTSS